MAFDPLKAAKGEPQDSPKTAPDPKPSTPAPATTVADPEPSSATEVSAPDWRALLDTVDEKELAKHAKVSGLVGTLAERQAKKAVAEAEARIRAEMQSQSDRERAARRQADLDALLEADPYKARDVIKADRAAQVAAEQQSQRYAQTAREMIAEADLPEEEVAYFRGRNYADLAAFTKDFNKRVTAYHGKAEAARMFAAQEKELRAAIRAEILAEQNGGEPTPDAGAGSATVGRRNIRESATISQNDYAKLGKTPKERAAAFGLS